jgi:hypothetical protein
MGTAFLLAILGELFAVAFFTTYSIHLISSAIEFIVRVEFNRILACFAVNIFACFAGKCFKTFKFIGIQNTGLYIRHMTIKKNE